MPLQVFDQRRFEEHLHLEPPFLPAQPEEGGFQRVASSILNTRIDMSE